MPGTVTVSLASPANDPRPKEDANAEAIGESFHASGAIFRDAACKIRCWETRLQNLVALGLTSPSAKHVLIYRPPGLETLGI